MRCFAIAALALCGCPKPPPPPSVTEPPRLSAEESCAAPTSTLPPLPAKPAVDPYRISHAAAMFVGATPVTFLCDLPDRVLGIGATQTVDGGKRVVGGTITVVARAPAPRAPEIPILPSSAGCKPDQSACIFATDHAQTTSIEMLREQRLHTSGWVHGADDLCRAVPDDTIAVCSTARRFAYVELGCDGALSLGLHDDSLSRVFDLDIESPVARLQGAPDAANGGDRWAFAFERANAADTAQMAKPRAAKQPKAARLAIDLAGPRATLTVDGVDEPCVAFALYRR